MMDQVTTMPIVLADKISPDTLERALRSLLIDSSFWSEKFSWMLPTESPDLTLTGAKHFGSWLFFSDNHKHIFNKDGQLFSVFAIICHQLRANLNNKVEFLGLNNQRELVPISLEQEVLNEQSGVSLKFGNTTKRIEKLTHAQIKAGAESDIGHKLTLREKAFAAHYTVTPFMLTQVREIKPRVCPDEKMSSFVQIHSGTTRQGEEGESTLNTATTVKLGNLIAATVATSCGQDQTSLHASKYSAIVTAAALDTVQRAVFNHVDEDQLQRYFLEMVMLLDKDESFYQEGQGRDIKFGGVVLYFDFDEKGQLTAKKAFVFGIGNIAVATRSGDSKTEPVNTLHLHAHSNEGLLGKPIFPSLKNMGDAIVTAKVVDITDNIESIQIMTGCDNTFYHPTSLTTFACKQDLPAYGKFKAETLLNNPQQQEDVLHLAINVQDAFDAIRVV